MRVWHPDDDCMERCYARMLQGSQVAAAWMCEQVELEAEALGLKP